MGSESPPNPRFSKLVEWLRWQETLHPNAIDLGLERVRRVLNCLGLAHPEHVVITVGGTNGKGSSVAFLEAILREQGFRVGAYTSPHLVRYNERIRLHGEEVNDAALCSAFARVDAARGDVSLTYFEFGTLAALDLFRLARLDVAILEVGLGGRLDAVNVVDADVALLTTIGIDHVEWLGADRESIGTEKAGIFRAGRPAVCADANPPASVLEHAHAIGARLHLSGRDFGYSPGAGEWAWWGKEVRLQGLPSPAQRGPHQLANAAGVLATLAAIGDRLPLTVRAIHVGLETAQLVARFQVFPGPVEWILDVTHNPHGAQTLAIALAERPCAGRTRAVVGMLRDKDVTGVLRALRGVVDDWYVATVADPRGLSSAQIASLFPAAEIRVPPNQYASVAQACHDAAREATAGDRILVFGSFRTIAEVLAARCEFTFAVL